MNQEQLVLRYRELDRDLARLSRLQIGEEKRKGPFLPTKENMDLLWGTWRDLKKQAEQLEEPDAVFSMLKHHFLDFLDTQEYNLKDQEKHPEHALLFFHWRLEDLSRKSQKTEEEKYQEIRNSLEKLDSIVDECLDLICEGNTKEEQARVASRLRHESAALMELHDQMGELFPDFTEGQRQQVSEALRKFCGRLQTGVQRLSGDGGCQREEMSSEFLPEKPGKAESVGLPVKDDLSITVKMDPEEYRILLEKKYGVSLEEILSWNQSEMEKTRSEAFAIAAKLDITEPAPQTMAEVNDILFKYEGPCDSPEEMFDRAAVYLKRTRALAHEYVNLPEDESCRCVKVPESCKDSYPWGGYEGGDFSVRPFRGQMFLNHYNYRNVTDGWIRLNALHEAYPGHHVQYVRAAVDETPETVKIGTKNIPMLEGTCLRTERAFEFIYGEDPFFPLFVAYRRHHASVRIYVDLMLFYYGATLEEVVQIYERELGFDRGTARAQVQAHQNMPGYFVCYYYGMKKLSQWEKEYGFSKKDYTELLFSAGYICIDRFEELLRMTPGHRERYFHDFAKLPEE